MNFGPSSHMPGLKVTEKCHKPIKTRSKDRCKCQMTEAAHDSAFNDFASEIEI